MRLRTIHRILTVAALTASAGSLVHCGSDDKPSAQHDAGVDGTAGAAGETTGGSGGAGGEGGIGGSTGEGGIGGSAGEGGIGGSAGEGGIGGSAGEGGIGGSAGEGGTGGCPTGCGALEECGNDGYCVAKSVPMPEGYSIDATQVTRSQYHAWLATNPSPTVQPPVCKSWNTSHQPDSECMESTWVCQGSNCGNYPMVCANWCDAFAYCQGVGKRLCGKIGGGENAYSDYANASKSQWYAACSSGGEYFYPYGDTYDQQACSGELFATSEVASFSDCQSSASGYEGVYDLSGLVWEWEDSCNGYLGTYDLCRARGGSILSNSNYLRCGYESGLGRGNHYDVVGFRCCSTP